VCVGRALAAAGNRQRARDELRTAHAELVACGARLYAADAARELQKLGQPSTAQDGLAALSRRERQVADLVADGRTNRQIAAALFLSEKTVEGYLTQSFAKLGVRTRAELAELVGRSRGASPRTDRQGESQGIPG
jgi:DNA-binding NarL/FixJ family response regulator